MHQLRTLLPERRPRRRATCPISMRWSARRISWAARLRSTCAPQPIRRARGRVPPISGARWSWHDRYDFMLFFDECYRRSMAASNRRRVEIRAKTPEGYRNLVVFKLACRSAPTSPACARASRRVDGDFLETFAEIRNLTRRKCRDRPARLGSRWAEEQMSPSSAKPIGPSSTFAMTADRPVGYRRPAGGFFLWLVMSQFGGGVEANRNPLERLRCQGCSWCLPGAAGPGGVNPGDDRVRVALVHDPVTIRRRSSVSCLFCRRVSVASMLHQSYGIDHSACFRSR